MKKRGRDKSRHGRKKKGSSNKQFLKDEGEETGEYLTHLKYFPKERYTNLAHGFIH